MNVAYPGLRAAIRAERRGAARDARRLSLERLAASRFLLAVNVYGCMFALGVLLNNSTAFWLLHMAPVWQSYIPAVLVPFASMWGVMSIIEARRGSRAARSAR